MHVEVYLRVIVSGIENYLTPVATVLKTFEVWNPKMYQSKDKFLLNFLLADIPSCFMNSRTYMLGLHHLHGVKNNQNQQSLKMRLCLTICHVVPGGERGEWEEGEWEEGEWEEGEVGGGRRGEEGEGGGGGGSIEHPSAG